MEKIDTIAKPRHGDWLQTFTGRQFWPLDPLPGEIDIRDIAHALANTCRYNGHCKIFYSVAEHCVLVSGFAPPENKLAALLHDASEAYLADVPRPVKRYLNGYHEIERTLDEAVAEAFGIDYPWHDEIKEIDERILADEQIQVMAQAPTRGRLTKPPLGVHIAGLYPASAEQLFLDTFHRLRVVH